MCGQFDFCPQTTNFPFTLQHDTPPDLPHFTSSRPELLPQTKGFPSASRHPKKVRQHLEPTLRQITEMFKRILLAVLSLLATYIYNKLCYKRFQQHARLPQMPPTTLLGHLKTLDDLIKRGEPDRHPGE